MSSDPRDQEIAELKERIRRLEETLADSQSLTAVGELAGTTAHEFNNIVGVVLGLARNRKPGRQPTDVTGLVEDVLLLLERELTKYRISVERKFEPVKPVLANGNQIQQVLINLLVNARQASPNGGRLLVKIRPCEESSQYVEIIVRDFGTGIPQEKLPHIFDAFYTTKQGPDETGKGGSGLGLALCKKIVEDHSGKIRVKSSVGKGTSFTIRLPLAPTTNDEE